jgi:hypothetical protein
MKQRRLSGVFLCLAVALMIARDAGADEQQMAPLDRPLRVFIDCRGPGCDQEFFRSELAWVDHVRDQNDADLHLLVTTQSTGGGGFEYTVRLIGRGRWQGREDTVLVTTEAGEPQDGQRRGLLRVFSLLLVRYALETPVGSNLALTAPQAGKPGAQTTAAEDPWNFWVYRFNFNSFLNGQQSDRFANFNVSAAANRITDAWKIQINSGFSYSENRFDLSSGRFISSNRGRHVNALVVKSVTDHWSLGGMVRASRSTFNNYRLNFRIAPGIEYNIFPYRESTNRQLTFQWTAGHDQFRYDQETIFGRFAESKWDEQFLALLSLRQPFGTVRVTGEFAHYLDDFDRHRGSVSADTEIRLFRGFSLNVDGNYQVLHDQLYLPRAGATDEEIIARQRQLETSFRYFVAVGFTYRFGSINNNIVNQRFGGGF